MSAPLLMGHAARQPLMMALQGQPAVHVAVTQLTWQLTGVESSTPAS